MSFYSECCRSFVPGNFTTFMAYHAVVPLHHACHPCDVCLNKRKPLSLGRLRVHSSKVVEVGLVANKHNHDVGVSMVTKLPGLRSQKSSAWSHRTLR
ncbi:hypothetical protein BHE74_00021644 [Ensete ventricosum]|nr:hypothetical protein BHE74_00021644 [Ensete ventricosum]